MAVASVAVRGDRTRVGEGAVTEILDSSLQQGDRADDIDSGTSDRVGLTERHLERGKVDDVRRPVRGKAGVDGGRVGDVERIASQACWGIADKVAQAMVGRPEVGDHDLRTFCEQFVGCPGPDAAEAAGHEKALCHRRSMAERVDW